MEIGWPTNVRHVAHVTFDRFHGFLGLPVEFEPEVPRRAPSASAKVFGVSTESMQCSYDCRGNSVPIILLLMQRSLYEQGGLKAEGIFRINAENSQEEFVRDQLNSGVVPDGIDVHCLAGLIKIRVQGTPKILRGAWFRELPTGVLDPLSPELVMQCQSDEECGELARALPPAEASLLNWAINLMADIVQEEHENKMNARNVAMVFAPNMTQMADPLTALMYAVEVMNFLKMLILKTLEERRDSTQEDACAPGSNLHDHNGYQSPDLQPDVLCEEKIDQAYTPEDLVLDDPDCLPVQNSVENAIGYPLSPHKDTSQGAIEDSTTESETALGIPAKVRKNSRRTQSGQGSNLNLKKSTPKIHRQWTTKSSTPMEKYKGMSIVSRINSKSERVEAWR
ncbi:hypothetical protein KSP40_PGU001348 [Platanthera guangdongensis]|uniref:Rho GTPase activating protein n=1 Tax=Platanthera guangdongensis TaxID=2320717 RepID=A0ABR2MZY1_9ASPA